MVWCLAQVAVAGGAWVSAPTPLTQELRLVAGSPNGGWLVVTGVSTPIGGVAWGQRVQPDGLLADASPVELLPYVAGETAMWDGSGFVVASATTEDYYERVAPLEVARVPAAGPLVPTRQVLATGLGWPRWFAGACGSAGDCVIAFQDEHSLAPLSSQWLSFDAAGVATPSAALDRPTAEPIEAVWDGDRPLVAARDYLVGDYVLLWPAAAGPADLLSLDHLITALAIEPGGVALVVWAEQDGGPGDSGAPNFAARFYAERVQRGVGRLDPTPLDLGGGSLRATMDAAFTGSTFVVALDDPDSALHSLVRVGVDGTVEAPVAYVDPDPTAELLDLVSGAPGHLLWSRATCASDDPDTSWCDDRTSSYVTVEMDVPDGGLCSDGAGCRSGNCVDGACSAEPAQTDTAATGTGDTGEAPGPACGCGTTGAGAGWIAVLLGPVLRRRRG